MNINNKNNKNIMDNNNSSDKNKTVTINHYHYNDSNNRRKNNRSRNNRRGRKQNDKKNNLDKSINYNHPPLFPPLPPSPPPSFPSLSTTSSNSILNTSNSIPNTSNSNNQKSHIIIRSTTNPSNMRIIPFNQSSVLDPTTPLFLNSNFINGLFPKDKKVDKDDIPKLELNALEEFVELKDIKNLDDLIKLGSEYNPTDKRRYSIDMNKLKNIIESLKDLKNVIGMESVKKNIFEQLLYILQELNDSNMMHTVIEGPPGVGKTLLGKIIAKIYFKLNFLKKSEKKKDEDDINDITNHLMAVLNPAMSPIKKKEDKKEDFKFKVVKRSDLVGQYVGSTAIKTQKVIDEAEGGILFIDEVYALGSGSERGDSFAKECIDTLNQNLSENSDKFICIIAGYPAEIEKCFFSQNEGLRRRFPFKYTIEKYDSKELAKIFESKVKEIKWDLHKDLKLEQVEKFIEENKKHFEHFGGDIENLLLNIKIKHSSRVFGKDPVIRKLITLEDIKTGFDEFKKVKKDKELPDYVRSMFM
jgi:SpoVK/Ycf46/Vps4 family AAA+-type ATPase